MSVSSNIVSNTKKGIMMLNKLKESSENYVPKEEKNKKELSFENNDVNLETANKNVKQLLTGFLFNLEKDDPEEYKNTLENFKKKIDSGSVTLQDDYFFDKNIKGSNYSNYNPKFFRKTKRKTTLYSELPQKYNLNSSKILENLKGYKNENNISNRSFSNFDYSNEALINKKKKPSLSSSNNNLKLPSKPKKINFNFKSPKNQNFSVSFDKELDEKSIPKSTRTKGFEKTLNPLSIKKSSLYNLFQRPQSFHSNKKEEEEKEFDIKNYKMNKKQLLFKTHTFTSPTNKKNINNKQNGLLRKITSKTQKLSFISLSDHNNSENESEEEMNITNLRGLTKKKVQEINNIRIKLKDNMIGNKLSARLNTVETTKSKDSIDSKMKKYKDKYRVLTRKNYIYDSLSDEEYDDEEENSLVILPDSKLILILDFLIALSVLYDIIYIPYYLSYKKYFCGASVLNYHIIIDLFISVLYVIDLFSNFFIAYYDFEEFLINELNLIALNYLSSYFIFDLIAAIPFKFYFFFHYYECKNLKSNLYNVDIGLYPYMLISLRILKLFKVYSKNTFINYCSNYFSHIQHFSQWGSLYIDIFVFFMGLHFVASLFIFIGRNQYPNWITELELQNSTYIHIYIASIYYLIATITTVGYGDITPYNQGERIFGLFLLIVGIIVYSFAVAGISNYIKEIDDKNADYEKKLKILEDIKINHSKLSDDLYDRVSRFLKYKHFNEKKDKNIIIDCLPLGLRNILVYEMYKPIISNFIFFKNFDNTDFIVRVILAFKPIIAMKNDILVKDGDFIEEIIFVKKGRLSLEIPIDLNTKNGISNLLTLRAANDLDKKSSIFSNFMSPRSKRVNSIPRFTLNPIQINRTKSYQVNDIPNLSPRKKRTLEMKIKEKEEEEEREREKNIQYVKILEIRKNEHFGDILMFLNKRSPICVKVKSKKAEFYFLNKTDAIEISTCYPRIWNKINKKSLFNMEQIKRLINKVVKIFFAAHGIKDKEYVSPDPRFSTIISVQDMDDKINSSELHSIPSLTDSNVKNKNSSNENSSLISNNSNNSEKNNRLNLNVKSKEKKKINKSFGIVEEENDDDNSSKSSNYENVNSEIPVPKLKGDKNSKSNKNNSKSYEEEISSLNSGQTLKVENFGKKFFDFSECGSLSDSILSYEKNYFSTNSHSNQTPFRPEDINEEIYPNEKGNIVNLSDFKFLNIDKNNKGKIINDQNYAIFRISQLKYNKKKIENSNKKKINVEINQGENIIFYDNKSSNENSINNSLIIQNNKLDIKENNHKYSSEKNIKSNLILNNKDVLKTILTNKNLRILLDDYPKVKNENNNLSIISTEISFTINSEYENLDSLSNHKFSKSVELRNKIKKILIEDNTIITLKSNLMSQKKKSESPNKISFLNLDSIQSHSSRTNIEAMENKKKYNKSNSIKIKRNENNNINKKGLLPRKSFAFGFKNNKRPNLLNVISQNIEKNQMNLNNPDEFYSEYFSNILTKKVPQINNCKNSFINNTIQKNNVNILRRKSANINSLLKGISVENVRRKSTRPGN